MSLRKLGWLRSLFYTAVIFLLSPGLAGTHAQGKQPPPPPGIASGQAAVDGLGVALPDVAAAYGMTPAQLETLLLQDHTLHVSAGGELFYIDDPFPGDEQASLIEAQEALVPPFPTSQTFLLHSLPGADHTIYLDFDGHVTVGTTWNSAYGVSTINSPPYDIDNNPASFNTTEHERIQKTWQIVAEDFAPFNVNVTTQDPGPDALRYQGGGDQQWGTRVVVTDDTFANCGCGGHAYIGSFDDSQDEPVFVYNSSLTGVAEASSHEVGHAILLSHDGTSSSAYYWGHGSGATSWGPIMGASYNRSVTQWSRGEYYDANNGGSGANYGRGPDDLAIISSLTNGNGFGYRTDDHGGSSGSASALDVSGVDVSGNGIIERTNDVDVFSFATDAGTVVLNISTAPPNANLDIKAELYNAGGGLVAQSDSASTLSASFNLSLAQGVYYLHIDGAGVGSPLSSTPSGYTEYGSLGQYSIAGTVNNSNDPPSFNADPVVEAGATAGAAYTGSIADDAGDPDGDTLTFSKLSGPAWLIVAADGALSGTPGSGDLGLNSWMVQVNDGSLVDQAELQITVNAPNGTPSFTSDPLVKGDATQDAAYSGSLAGNASDPEADPLSFGKLSGPAWLAVAANGALSGTPTNADVGQNSWMVEVSDGIGGSDQTTLQILVTNVNDDPTFTSDPIVEAGATEGVAYGGSIADAAEDIDDDQLTFAAVSGPAWLAIGVDGALAGTPANSDVGLNSWVVQVSDGNGGVDQAALQIAVAEAPPAAPTNLTATAVGSAQIDLSWTPNGNTEDGFRIERSVSGGAWEHLDEAGAGSTSFADSGLAPDTSYSYRVYAFNGGGDSAFSNVATAVTDPLSVEEHLATNDLAIAGSVAGSYVDTRTNNPIGSGSGVQAITEIESGGKPSNRHSYLEHKWTFDVRAAESVALHVDAWTPASSDDDSFRFAYSANDVDYTLITVPVDGTDDDSYQIYSLPSGLSGTVYIRVTDSDRTSGNRSLDTVYFDHLFIRTQLGTGQPPAAPSNLLASPLSSSQISLNWIDNSIDEFGFKIERAADAAGPWTPLATLAEDVTNYVDGGLNAATTYAYRVYAYNGNDSSAYSNVDSATTDRGGTINFHISDLDPASASGSKNRWNATVFVEVKDSSGQPVATATVSGDWGGGANGSGSCVTAANGRCQIDKNNLKSNVSAVTFTVAKVEKVGYSYDAGANTDGDVPVDSDGTSVTVSRP